MVISTPLIPYLYLKEGISLAEGQALLKTYQLAAVPQERYYYNYKDALRIIDFVQTQGVYDGWVFLIHPKDIENAQKVYTKHPDKFQAYVLVERVFLEGLSTSLLQEALGSQHAVGSRLGLIKALLEERGIVLTEEMITTKKATVQARNEKQQTYTKYMKVLIWGIFILGLLVYVGLMSNLN